MFHIRQSTLTAAALQQIVQYAEAKGFLVTDTWRTGVSPYGPDLRLVHYGNCLLAVYDSSCAIWITRRWEYFQTKYIVCCNALQAHLEHSGRNVVCTSELGNTGFWVVVERGYLGLAQARLLGGVK